MRRLIHLTNVAPVRDFLWARAAKQFLRERAEAGVLIRDRDALTAIGEIKTLLVDTRQVMEGWNAVRMAAAPLFACDLDKFRRQGSWMMLTAGVALGCADAKPLETFARELNFESERMAKQFPKVDVFAYDDARRVETTVHRDAGGFRAYTKGEPEAVLARCLSVLDGRERVLTDDDRRHALASAKEMESLGLETLAFATRWAETPGDEERNMVFLGVVGVGDLVRTDAPAAFAALRATGVRPLLVSEEPLPEAAIRAGNVLRPHALILTGGQIEAMDGAALRDAARDTDAFLSMNASQRGKLLRALRAEGSVAALSTGPDGGVRLSIGRGEDAEAALRSGGLPAVAELIESIRSLRQSFAAVREGEGPPGGRA